MASLRCPAPTACGDATSRQSQKQQRQQSKVLGTRNQRVSPHTLDVSTRAVISTGASTCSSSGGGGGGGSSHSSHVSDSTANGRPNQSLQSLMPRDRTLDGAAAVLAQSDCPRGVDCVGGSFSAPGICDRASGTNGLSSPFSLPLPRPYRKPSGARAFSGAALSRQRGLSASSSYFASPSPAPSSSSHTWSTWASASRPFLVGSFAPPTSRRKRGAGERHGRGGRGGLQQQQQQNQQQGRLQHRFDRLQCAPHAREMPPRRDTGIASEKDWGITLKSVDADEPVNESGLNEDGSTWYRESGEDLGDNGYRCRWTVMGGRNADGSAEWKETWWEKSDWTGYKELGAEKSGRNAQGDSWWETWQEVFRQDEWSGLARIEKSAQKQAKSRRDGMWSEKWWEKYNAKGWTEKGAHKYGHAEDQSWWEKWGEQFDGRGAVVKWTDKWAEKDNGTKWGDKWEERFSAGVGTRRGETWHASTSGVPGWSRTWGEEHFGDGKVHKYGKSTSGELWDVVVSEPTYYEAEPHFGWADAVASSLQLLSIEIRERPPPGGAPIPSSPPPTPPPPPLR